MQVPVKAELPIKVEEGITKVSTVIEDLQQLDNEADDVQVCY